MTMPTWDNDFDDLYHEATKDMTNRERDMFAHSMVGAMSPFVDAATAKRCIDSAVLIHRQDLHLVKR